jgi:ABC-2 type transport system permease protein
VGKILLITGRELGAYFRTWTGYIIAAVALLINGLLFNAFAIGDKPKFSADVLADFFYFSSGIGMVAGVFLAMRLIAEEKQSGTITLFFTSPISERQLVYGKFLSALTFFLCLETLTLYLPALIFISGKVSLGHLAAGYLGVVLLGMTVLAISLFASAVAPNQMVSGVLGAAITVTFLVLWMLSLVVDEPFRDLFSYLAIHNNHFMPFARGLVNIKDVVFYGSMILFFIECSVRALEARRFEG